MITTRSTVRAGGGFQRNVTTGQCVLCGERQSFLDLTAADTIDHRCGTPAMGATWWLSKAAPRAARRRRAA